MNIKTNKLYKDMEIAVCCDCGEEFVFLEYETTFYKGKPLCFNCFDNKYGYCNECGELNPYNNMNGNIVCKECERFVEQNT